ncbi:MAG: Crp/Fnr family transcriptional regulator [Flavobacterium sp.]|nr:Crp/Fnr family transcriptional regulator [Flavobacterium sp.]
MENIKLILNRFEPISEDSFNELSKLLTKKTYSKKSFLIKYPKDFDKFFILFSGLTRSLTIAEDGSKNCRSILKPPALFLSLKKENRKNNHIFNIEFDCLTEVTVYEGNFNKFRDIAAERTDLCKLYIRGLETTLLNLIEKDAMRSHLNASEKYLCLKNNIPNIENLIQLNQIANYLNITPIQFSRIRKNINNSKN